MAFTFGCGGGGIGFAVHITLPIMLTTPTLCLLFFIIGIIRCHGSRQWLTLMHSRNNTLMVTINQALYNFFLHVVHIIIGVVQHFH